MSKHIPVVDKSSFRTGGSCYRCYWCNKTISPIETNLEGCKITNKYRALVYLIAVALSITIIVIPILIFKAQYGN